MTNHDLAAAKIDEALHLIETAESIDRVNLTAIITTARTALGKGRYLTPKELADRWRCSARGIVKELRISGNGPEYLRPTAGNRTAVLYPIASIEAFEKANFTKGKYGND